MKHIVRALTGFIFLATLFSCTTTDSAGFTVSSSVKKPEIIDHKNQKWGSEPPEWLSMEISELEQMDKYKDFRLFRVESEKSKDLEGAQLWLKNFTANSEIAREVQARVRDAGAAAAVGGPDGVETYVEQVVSTLSSTTLHGVKKEGDYWILRRYFDADGDIEGDYYTVVILYSIPRKVLTRLIQDAINGVEKPETEEQLKARDLVNTAMLQNF